MQVLRKGIALKSSERGWGLNNFKQKMRGCYLDINENKWILSLLCVRHCFKCSVCFNCFNSQESVK